MPKSSQSGFSADPPMPLTGPSPARFEVRGTPLILIIAISTSNHLRFRVRRTSATKGRQQFTDEIVRYSRASSYTGSTV